MTDESGFSRERPDLPEIDEVTDASMDSFPASDPPAWSSMRVGPPRPPQPSPDVLKKR